MQVNYSDKKVLKGSKSIFLAGPTPRSLDVETWRKKAIKILEELGFDGIVYVPELEHDNRTFNYDNQVWWEREALHNASSIVFWVPRSEFLPAFTTNVEFGYWIARNNAKVIYGRPDDSEKNKYLDWLYQTETGKEPINNLSDLLKEAIKIANEQQNKTDLDSYELNIIKDVMNRYPEIMNLTGEIQFTPESYGVNSEKTTYGQLLFKEANPNQLKEFDRTILSVLLYFYIKDNRYDKFVEQQSGNNKLSKETFDQIRYFMEKNFNTPEKKNLLLYYMVINDLGKCQSVIDVLKAKGIESVDHDLLLTYLLQYEMLPSFNNFSEEGRRSLINVLNNGINLAQYIQGECVDYSFNKVLNLSPFEKNLMVAEAMLDIGGVLGHINNKNGSSVLNQSTVDNILTAENILSTCQESTKIFDEFLTRKADKMQISFPNAEVRKAITRICLMMRLSSRTDIQVVENEITNNLDKYRVLIDELNQSGYNNQPAILLYYSPALLSNANEFFKRNNSENSISDALKICLPFMQNIMIDTRAYAKQENGIITVMLKDVAMVASQDPTQLNTFKLNFLGENEALVKRQDNNFLLGE